jgi:tetratricopeptide (TPR) repeat protein
MRRLTRQGRALALAALQRQPGVFRLALELREKWVARRQTYLLGEVQAQDVTLAGLDPRALDLYRRALAMRGLGAIRDIYAFYSENVLNGSGVQSAPHALLSSVEDAGDDQVSQWLIESVRRSAGLAEAWLELGYLRREAGDANGAIEAFGRAQNSSPNLRHPSGQPDLRVIAATERAKLLQCCGRIADALAALDAVPSTRFAPWSFHLCRGQILADLDRAEEALVAFERCLEWRLVAPRFTGFLPRDLAEFPVEALR